LNSALAKIEANVIPTWDGLIDPLCEIEELLHRVWSPIEHLNHVANSKELRSVYEKAHKLVVDFSLKFSQSQAIFDGLVEIQNGKHWKDLDEAQHRCIEQRIHSSMLAGVALKGAEREEFNNLNKELSQLEFEFSNRLLDSTKAFQLEISNKNDMEGLPQSLLDLSSQIYNQKFPDKKKSESKIGPWIITLDAPVLVPFLENCRNRELRKAVYLAYISRASTGTHDNAPSILKILKIRKRIASLLSYENYAQLSLSRKMVSSVEEVFRFEEDLRQRSYEKSREEFQELQTFAKSNGMTEPLRHWDIAFWAMRLQEDRFKYKEEDLKPYFAFDKVLKSVIFVKKTRPYLFQFRPFDCFSVCRKVRYFRPDFQNQVERPI
jgi:oligopeptidase A